jgi:class 3 adenylate cyclase
MAAMADDDLSPGLVDPDAPDADAQRTLVAFLLEQGVPIDELRTARERGDLTNLLAAAVLWPDTARITMAELAARSGLSEESTRRARRMLGFVDPGDAARCRPREVEMITSFAAGAALFGEERTLPMSRVLGTSTAAISEAAISLFTDAMAAPLKASGVTDAEYGLRAREALLAFETVCSAVDVMLRLNFERALSRLGGDITVDELDYAIAFVDIVGSTTMAGELERREVAAALRDFDRIAAEAAVLQMDVRLVKLIGDGAMLAGRNVESLVISAEDIVAAVARHDVLRAAKAGVTFGSVAVHDGDYYGQVVNLAARATNAALPGEVLVDTAAARHLPRRTEPAGDFDLKGFAEPVTLYRLTPREER